MLVATIVRSGEPAGILLSFGPGGPFDLYHFKNGNSSMSGRVVMENKPQTAHVVK